MASVRITITSRPLGDVTVENDPEYGITEPDAERRHIEALLSDAIAKVKRTYEIGPTP